MAGEEEAEYNQPTVKRNAHTGGSSFNLTKIASWGFVFLSACSLSFAQQPSQYPELPAGTGKDTLVRVCSKCHSPDNVIANGQDRAAWEATITKMAGFGAAASDDEFTEILEYLVKNFPANAPVNVNKATSTQLVSGLGLSATEADAVIQYRKTNGDFKSLDDLKKVPDVDAKKLDAKKTRIAF